MTRLRSRGPVRAATAFGAALTVAALAVGPAANAQESVLWMGGTGGTIAHFLPPDMFGTPDSFLGGAFRNHEFTVVQYPSGLWPLTGLQDPTLGASVNVGTDNLLTAARSATGPLVLAGVSQGAMAVQQAEAVLNNDPTIPSDTTFILIADPNLGALSGAYGTYLPIIDYTPRPIPATRFTTIVVTNEYDGFGEPIRQPWNLLTLANAFMGLAVVHPFAHNSDIAAVAPGNIITTVNSQGGTTINYLVPTQHLPLTQPLRDLGIAGPVVDGIDTALRPIIDSGYLPWPPPRPVPAGGSQRPGQNRGAGSAASLRAVPRPVSATASARTEDSSSRPAATGTSARHSRGR